MMKIIAVSLWMLALFGAPVLAGGSDLDKGAAVYRDFCSHCHGLKMVNPGNSSFDLRKFPKHQKDRFYQSVTHGRGDMPAWGDMLLPEELDLLWHYVVTRGGKEPAPVDSSRATTPNSGAAATDLSALLITPGTLTACLAKNGGVMSSRRARGGAGMDYELSLALAEQIGLTLKVEWFDSEQDDKSTPVREFYAMLAYGVCDIVPGFALYETALGAFYQTRAALPRWDDRPATMGREFQVDLEPIAVSAPYDRMEMGVVYRTPEFERDITEIADMDGLKLGVEQGTLAGVLTLRQGTERMVKEATTLNPGPDFLWRMEQGEFDAALVTIGAYDFQRKQNPVSTLTLDEYRNPIGFNLAVAVLKRNSGLLGRIDPMIDAMVADGRMAALAVKSKHTYTQPRKPYVQHRLTMQDILGL